MAAKTLQKLVIGSVLSVLSGALFAMGACPMACNNQTDENSCRRYQCYTDDNQCMKCTWSKDANPQCAPSQDLCEKN